MNAQQTPKSTSVNQLEEYSDEIKADRKSKNPSKTIRLINTYSVNNVGDAAIYAALFFLAKENGFDHVQTLGLDNVVGKIERYIGFESSQQSSGNPDAYLAVGGDIFNNARPKLITRQFLKNVDQLKKSPSSTVLFGQSIPRSCHGLSFRYLCHYLKKLNHVVVRDVESFKRLSACGVENRLSYDAAFAVPINQRHHFEIEKFNTLPFNRLALLSLRSFGQLYPQNDELFQQELIQLVTRLNNHGLIPAVMLQADVNNSDSDQRMIENIKQYTNIEVINPFTIHQTLRHISPWQIAQAYIAQAKIVIGVRYHTAIFRLLSGKMPFNIFYSNKGEDLCNRLNVPGVEVQQFSVDKHFQSIINSGNKLFDPRGIIEQVTKDFQLAMLRV